MVFLVEKLIRFMLVMFFFKKPFPPVKQQQSISILQPILSGDPTLWKCLAANLTMQTNHFTEFIWLVDDNDDEGIEGCKSLITKFSDKNIKLIILPPPPQHVNPKTFKLLKGLNLAANDLIAVLDDDTILPDGGLDKTARFLEKQDAGIAFGLPYYVNFSNLWSGLTSCFVNSNSLFTYIPYTFFSEPITINGMYYMLKKSVFQEVVASFEIEKELTDDYAIAQAVKKKGYTLIQTPVCHGISTQVSSFSHYLRLLQRWFIFPQVSLMQSKNKGELAVFFIGAFLPTLFPLTLIILLLFVFNVRTLGLTVGYFFVNLNFLIAFNRYFFRSATPASYWWGLLIQPVLLPFYIMWSFISPKQINWRGHIMEVKKDGKFTFVNRRKA
jgi:ceramide glucosyltransferase